MFNLAHNQSSQVHQDESIELIPEALNIRTKTISAYFSGLTLVDNPPRLGTRTSLSSRLQAATISLFRWLSWLAFHTIALTGFFSFALFPCRFQYRQLYSIGPHYFKVSICAVLRRLLFSWLHHYPDEMPIATSYVFDSRFWTVQVSTYLVVIYIISILCFR